MIIEACAPFGAKSIPVAQPKVAPADYAYVTS